MPLLLRELAIVAVTAAAAACIPTLSLPDDAKLVCEHDVDCPAGALCSSGGFCLRGGPCVVQGSADAVADGTDCGDGDICVGGACVAPFCGDGVVQLAGGEECDPRRDPRCRADCTLPRCGDGEIDPVLGETCDADDATCIDCTFMCTGVVAGSPRTLTATGDCDLDDADGCECVPEQRPIEDASSRIFVQAAVRGDTLYLVSANRALNPADLRFRLERINLAGGGAFTRTTLYDDESFVDLVDPEDPDDADVFFLRSGTGHNELHRFDAGGDDAILHSASSIADAIGRIAVDGDSVWGAGPDGIRRVRRDDGSFSVVPGDTCHDGRVGRLVSCGDVVACFDAFSGDVSTINKRTQDVSTIFHVDVVAAPAGGALNDQILFCRDGVLLLDDRIAIWSFDGAGGRNLEALLPKLQTTASLDVARSFKSGVLVSGVVPRTSQQVTVFVDLDRRTSTVLMPGSFLARHNDRVVAADGFTGSLVFIDVVEGLR